MKVHGIQHVPFEGLGYIEEWANAHDAEITCTRFFADEKLPTFDSVDGLVVMGGPMNIHDHDLYPWLVTEKTFIKKMIDAGKPVLGICLGAQLIADVQGAEVYPGPQKEIGWFPIRRTPDAPEWLPETFPVFHWHGDTFDTPQDAVRIASSDAYQNQGFIFNDNVVALQFHIETTEAGMEALIRNCHNELPIVDEKPCSAYVQTAEEMRAERSNFIAIHAALQTLLDSLFNQSGL